MRVAARELGPRITVNAVAPGATDTPLFSSTEQLPGYQERAAGPGEGVALQQEIRPLELGAKVFAGVVRLKVAILQIAAREAEKKKKQHGGGG